MNVQLNLDAGTPLEQLATSSNNSLSSAAHSCDLIAVRPRLWGWMSAVEVQSQRGKGSNCWARETPAIGVAISSRLCSFHHRHIVHHNMSDVRTDAAIVSAIFPTELLLLVKEFIPDSDLRTHVCFYNTCRTTAAFYGDNSQQAEFWRRACVLSGIGWLKADSSWKEIAFETIARDGFCAHPRCGGALLESNGEC